ncbi:D-erythronate dehydrogenase [Halotalea alkalilenta]|uniref:NAD-dependent epimerase n=1 Tax=Halotalea alkalilenta TaxID=376489 RepID=A0A172YIH3_9GAMM|nr:D-erythronate dehydrogenase [Halotalea alkalilenta]ANF59028.1 NAD-dependent epimerase [Halotalea alkalilenta]
MHLIVTGGAGFLGSRLISALLSPKNERLGLDVTHITSLDRVACPLDHPNVESVIGDIEDPGLVRSLIREDTFGIAHLAAIVSSQAESDFELGMHVNLDATRAILDACRLHSKRLRLLFTSSLAVFGAGVGRRVEDHSCVKPRSSYGTQKAIGELLVSDYSRHGFVDGRVCRLPTIVVRPGRPNAAASSFASGIIREPLSGVPSVCPVSPSLSMWLSSPETVIDNLIHALAIEERLIDEDRVINLPGISVSVEDMLGALERQAGKETRSLVSFEHDARIDAIVSSWPESFDTQRADALGFHTDAGFDAIIDKFIASRSST